MCHVPLLFWGPAFLLCTERGAYLGAKVALDRQTLPSSCSILVGGGIEDIILVEMRPAQRASVLVDQLLVYALTAASVRPPSAGSASRSTPQVADMQILVYRAVCSMDYFL